MKSIPCDRIAGVILAAGEGKRFGECKALATLDGVTFLDMIAKSLKDVGCEPVIVVGGREVGRIIAEATRLGIDYIINADWKKGQFSSLKTGFSCLSCRKRRTASMWIRL